MYADKESEAMRVAIAETDRRREIQLAYNREHGITPETVSKGISDISDFLAMESNAPRKRRRSKALDGRTIESPEELEKIIVGIEEEMLAAAEELHFEEAARLRDELKELRRDLEGMRA
jgi:excinuclease ABC subunit B